MSNEAESGTRIREVLSQNFFVQKCVALGSTLSFSLGSIFFIPQSWVSAILWLALIQNPRYAAFAVMGIVIGASIEKVFMATDEPCLGGGLKANALLATVMVAWLTGAAGVPLGAQLAIAAVAAAAASIIAAVIIRVLRGTNLPALVWGYCVVASMLFAVCPNCTELAIGAMPAIPIPEDANGWLAAFIRSMGSLIYLPSFEAGLLVAFSIILWSRIMFFSGAVGWISGACIALAFEKLGITYYWLPAAYNYFIVGMALGSVYFLPSRISILIAAAGGCGAAFFGFMLNHLLQGSPIANLPIVAAMTVWVVMGAVSLTGNRCAVWLNNSPDLRPEDAWWRVAFWSQRFGYKDVLLSMPLAGDLKISQGFNGLLSHAGKWRHALDFQRPITVDNSLDPALNIWGAPVYSPASGVIERIKNTIPDNPLGVCNYADNWGNYIVIRLDQDGWVLLAHLQQGSIMLMTGVRVEAGDYLGKVGNSGRSPLPHLHLQAQNSAEPGAPTSSFRLVNYQSVSDGVAEGSFYQWNAAALPVEGDIIRAGNSNKSVHTVLASIAPGSGVWTVEHHGCIPQSFHQAAEDNITRVNITLNEAGEHLFSSNFEEGTLVACLAPDAWRITETKQLTSPFMKLLGLVAPSIPYSVSNGMTWRDSAPIIPTGPASWLTNSIAPYLGKHFLYSNCKCISEPNLEGNSIQIETTLEPSSDSMPIKLTCQFEILRGPVRVQASFKNGSVVYSLLSFEQGLPFDSDLSH